MKKALSLITALTLALTLAGCSGDSSTENEKEPTTKPETGETITTSDLDGVTIEFWHAQSNKNGEAIQLIVDEFNKTNEYGITVNATYQGTYNDTSSKLQAALVAGNYPNVGQAYGNNIALMLESGKVANLSPYFSNKDYGYTQTELDDFVPSYLEEMYAFEDGNAHQTMLGKSAEVFYYNVDFFEEHNLEVPTTTDELTEVAKKASEIIGKPAFGVDSFSNLFIMYSQGFGAQYTNNKGEIFFGNEENRDKTLEFLNWWKAGVDGGYFRQAGEDTYMSGPFTNKDAVMFLGSNSGAAYINAEFEWSTAFVPAGPEGLFTVQQGGNMFMLDSDDDKEDLASWLFLKYMMEPEVTNQYALTTGYVPIRKSSYELEEYKTYVEENKALGHIKDVIISYPEGSFKYDPIFATSYEVRTAVQDILEKITFEKADPAEVLDNAYADLVK